MYVHGTSDFLLHSIVFFFLGKIAHFIFAENLLAEYRIVTVPHISCSPHLVYNFILFACIPLNKKKKQRNIVHTILVLCAQWWGALPYIILSTKHEINFHAFFPFKVFILSTRTHTYMRTHTSIGHNYIYIFFKNKKKHASKQILLSKKERVDPYNKWIFSTA